MTLHSRPIQQSLLTRLLKPLFWKLGGRCDHTWRVPYVSPCQSTSDLQDEAARGEDQETAQALADQAALSKTAEEEAAVEDARRRALLDSLPPEPGEDDPEW